MASQNPARSYWTKELRPAGVPLKEYAEELKTLTDADKADLDAAAAKELSAK